MNKPVNLYLMVEMVETYKTWTDLRCQIATSENRGCVGDFFEFVLTVVRCPIARSRSHYFPRYSCSNPDAWGVQLLFSYDFVIAAVVVVVVVVYLSAALGLWGLLEVAKVLTLSM